MSELRQYLADALEVEPEVVSRGTLLMWIAERAFHAGDAEREERARAAAARGVEAVLERVRRKRETRKGG